MFIVSKRNYMVRRADDSAYLIPKDFIGEIPQDVAESDLVQRAIKGGTIAVPEGKKDKELIEADETAEELAAENDIRPDADYVYITSNNTIYGTKYNYVPETGDIPLVADMSSNILSEEVDVTKFGVIWAGAQKNVAPAGVTIVIIREELLGKAAAEIPTYLDYKIHADNGSMYNTPPCFSIYVAGEVFKYLKRIGGIKEMERRNKEKAAMLYDYIDASSLYKCPVAEEDRSLMNVVFVTGDAELDKKFVAQAKEKGLVNLAGHRSIGGMRASIYNAMPKEGVEALVQFMKEFEEKNK